MLGSRSPLTPQDYSKHCENQAFSTSYVASYLVKIFMPQNLIERLKNHAQ